MQRYASNQTYTRHSEPRGPTTPQRKEAGACYPRKCALGQTGDQRVLSAPTCCLQPQDSLNEDSYCKICWWPAHDNSQSGLPDFCCGKHSSFAPAFHRNQGRALRVRLGHRQRLPCHFGFISLEVTKR